MGTDGIVDFFVEYYIWFIIGAAIIAVAIIGFFADKKKILPSQKLEKKKNKKKKKNAENIEIDENIKIENTEKKETAEIDKNVVADSNMVVSNQDIDKLNEEIKSDSNNLEKINDDDNIQKLADETLNPIAVENEKEEVQDNEFSQEKIEAIAKDINKIEKMDFSEQNVNELETVVDEESKAYENLKEEDIISEKNLNPNLEDTMQISYSQLKEMVEDIIAENEKGKTVDSEQKDIDENVKTNENQSIPDEHSLENNGVIDMPLPDLEKITVDSINKKDEDEDDVWKF